MSSDIQWNRRLRVLREHLFFSAAPADGAAASPARKLKELTPEQLEQYKTKGYVLLRQMLSPREVAELQAELDDLIERSPLERGDEVDKTGKPLPGRLTDNYKFTDPVKADDPRTWVNASAKAVLNRIAGVIQFAPQALATAGNPRLLAAVEDIYGADFVPFGESYVLKPPNDGAGFTWHQDTGQPGKAKGRGEANTMSFPYPWQPERGINLGVYLHDSTLENGCLLVVPGSQVSHRDMEAMTKEYGFGKMLPGAEAIPCKAGDVILHARNVIHGSMQNNSDQLRGTLYLGFLPKDATSVLHGEEEIRARQRRVPLYVAHRQASGRYPEETPYTYTGLGDASEECSTGSAKDFSFLDKAKYPDLNI